MLPSYVLSLFMSSESKTALFSFLNPSQERIVINSSVMNLGECPSPNIFIAEMEALNYVNVEFLEKHIRGNTQTYIYKCTTEDGKTEYSSVVFNSSTGKSTFIFKMVKNPFSI